LDSKNYNIINHLPPFKNDEFTLEPLKEILFLFSQFFFYFIFALMKICFI